MIDREIRAFMEENRDAPYGEFQKKLIPDTAFEIRGVRTPVLRAYARALAKREDLPVFLGALPHGTFEEMQLHAFVISLTRDFATALDQTDAFLPYVDNWATCDQLSPVSFKRAGEALLPSVDRWLSSTHDYTVRFGIGRVMAHFLGEAYRADYALRIARMRSDAYYVNMMRAWFFATALAKNKKETLPLLEERVLEPWTHRKTIQKALESDRIPDPDKEYLRSLR